MLHDPSNSFCQWKLKWQICQTLDLLAIITKGYVLFVYKIIVHLWSAFLSSDMEFSLLNNAYQDF